MFFKKLVSDSVIYAIGPQIPKIAGLFILPIITKYLTPTDYGIAGVLISYTALLSSLYDLGFSVIMMNSFYKYPTKWQVYWKQFHFYLSIWALFYGTILGILLYAIMPLEAKPNTFKIIFLIVTPSLFFNITTTIATRYYQFSRKPLYIGFVSALTGLLSIFLNYYLIAIANMAYMGWFISTFISSFCSFALYFYPVYFKYKLGPILKFKKHFLISNLKISAPVIPHNYSSYLLNSSDLLVMERLKVNTANIGNYNIAYTFGGYMEFFGSAIGMAIGPIYTKLFSNKNKEASKAAHFITHQLQYFFIIVSFIIALWCKELFVLLIRNSELRSVYPLAIIIIMGYAYRPYYWTCITRLQYSEQTSQLWKISFMAGIINVVLNIILIPIFGYFVAGITTFISLLYIGFSGYFLSVFKRIETQQYHPKLFIFLIVLSTILVFLFKDYFITTKIIISIGILIPYFIYTSKQKLNFKSLDSIL